MRFGLCRKWNLGKFEWDSDELRSRNIGNQMDLVGLSLLVIGNPILGWIVYPYLGMLINGEKYGSKKKNMTLLSGFLFWDEGPPDDKLVENR